MDQSELLDGRRGSSGVGSLSSLSWERRRCSAAADDSTKGSPGDDTSSKPAFIDQLIEEAWQKAGVKPAKPATDDEFMRRAYLDLLGRIPNVQEARAFLQTREKDKRDKLVTYLLDHPDFAKNFATQWTVLLDRSRQPGPDGRSGFADELAAEAIRLGSPLERSRS